MSGADAAGHTMVAIMGTLFLAGCATAVWLLLRSVANPPPWHRRIRILSDRPWNAADVAIVLCVVAVGQVVAGAISIPDAQPHSWQSFGLFVVQSVMAFHGTAAAAIWIIFRARNLNSRRSFGIRTGRAAMDSIHAVFGYLAAFPAICAAAMIAGMLLTALGERQIPQDVILMAAEPEQSVVLRVYLCVLTVLVAPVVEEMLFRGMALPVLTRYIGFPAAVTIVSIIFALMHGHIPSLAPLFVVAVAFSLGYTLTGSLRVPIVMHAVFNAVNLGNVLLFPDIVNSMAQ